MVSGCVSIAQLNTNTIFLGGNKLEKDKDLNTAIIKGLFLLTPSYLPPCTGKKKHLDPGFLLNVQKVWTLICLESDPNELYFEFQKLQR
jgi:hypothetical protein